MSLEPVVNQSASYQDSTRTIVKTAGKITSSYSTGVAQSGITGVGTKTTTKVGTSGHEDKNNGQQKSDEQANAQRLKTAVDAANKKIKNTQTRCEFSYNNEVNRVSIKVLDKETDEVIREIPPEETLEMVQKLWEMAGILVDEKL